MQISLVASGRRTATALRLCINTFALHKSNWGPGGDRTSNLITIAGKSNQAVDETGPRISVGQMVEARGATQARVEDMWLP